MLFALAYGSTSGSSNWNAACDLDPDGKIDFEDLMLFALHYGEEGYTLTITTYGNGTTEPAEGTYSYTEGTVVHLTATPPPGPCYDFYYWEGEVEDDLSETTTITMDTDQTVQAVFQEFSEVIHNTTAGTISSTIQSAIDGSDPGDTIVVCPGTYYENIVFANKNITLQSADPSDPDIVAATIIDGGGINNVTMSRESSRPPIGSVVRFTGGDTSTLSGFTIRNANSSMIGGIYVGVMDFTNPTITGNTITANFGSGIYISYARATVIGNTIISNTGNGINFYDSSGIIAGNTITSNVCGVDLYNASVTIDNNIISNNSDNGIRMAACSPIITGNNIFGNTAENGGGIRMTNQSSPTITGNNIYGNIATNLAGGIFVDYSFGVTITGNTISDNTANDGGGIALKSGSIATIAENEIDGNTAYGEGGGIYTEDSNSTIEDNEITGNPATDGGGIFVTGSAYKPTIIGNDIIDNEVTDDGGGIYVGSGSSPIIDDNIVTGNKGMIGGGILVDSGSPEITSNEITNNEASAVGGGICMGPGAAPIIGGNDNFNTICGNSPNQVYPDSYSNNYICDTCPCP